MAGEKKKPGKIIILMFLMLTRLWFGVMGPDTKLLGEIKSKSQLYQNQHAKTIAALLGFNFLSPSPIGETIKSVLN